ncbi:hypothetical protein WOLCODRAFT_139918 [Wolfiporia cocos MD-104 SS10]|uniref:CFEM domain-containing protein n=1 Tax=Wolfiporia cocos (strain MD-104) TaxID=742152 RepID=A0A2H3J6W2_WOLCO|nr:hypothetical protein WOLCODRAFT_139918 [Wolfiporia cocos MD-104 SS10]
MAADSSSAVSTSFGSLSATSTSSNTVSYPSLGSYSTCVDDCFVQAISAAGCTSEVDVSCFCFGTNATAFTAKLTSCMAQYCPSSLASAESLSDKFCAVASPSTVLSFAITSIPSSTASSLLSSGSASGFSTTSAPSTTSTSASSTSGSATGSASTSAALRNTDTQLVMLSAGVGLAVLSAVFVAGW